MNPQVPQHPPVSGRLILRLSSMFMRIADETASQYAERSIYEDVDYVQFALTFLASLIIIICAWLIFEYMARHPSWRCLVRQRLFHPKCIAATRKGDDHRDAPPDVNSWNSVLLGAFSIPEEKLPGLMGPGGHLTYRLMQYCVYFANLSLVYSLTVLVPLYISQFYHATKVQVDLLKMISISFISPTNPSHMWVVVISCYLLCAYWAMAIYTEWQHIKAVRLSWEHDSRSYNLQSHYTLMVERTESNRRLTELKSYFANLLGKEESEVQIVMPVYYTPVLNSLESRRFWLQVLPQWCMRTDKPTRIAKYTQQIDQEKERLRFSIVSSGMATGVSKPSYNRQSLSMSVDEGPDMIGNGSLSQTTVKTASSIGVFIKHVFIATHSPTYFVTLRTMRSRTILSHMYRAQGDTFARITPASAPRDYIWSNLTVNRSVIVTRRNFARFFLIAFSILYPVPLNALLDLGRKYRNEAASNNLFAPDNTGPPFMSREWFREILFLFFPAIVQVTISQLFPRILRLLSHKYEKFKTYQEVTQHVIHRTYLLQLLTIYIIVYGEMWIDISRLKNGFSYFIASLVEKFRRLGRAMPPVALYFSTSVMVTMIMEIAYPLILLLDIILVVWDRYVAGNIRAWEECDIQQIKYTGSIIAYLTLLNTMFTFSVMAPVVVFFCWIFWCLSHVVTLYQLIYQNNRRYEVGTSYSPTIYAAISYSLIFSQLSVYLVMWSYSRSTFGRSTNSQLYTIGGLVFLLIVFKYVLMKNFRLKSNEFVSLAISADIDQTSKPEQTSSLFDPEYYLQPAARTEEPADLPIPTRLSVVREGSQDVEATLILAYPTGSEKTPLIKDIENK
jgi:hypothetical protein